MKFNSFSIRIKLILILSLTSAIALFISSLTFSTYIYNTQKTNYINSLNQLASIGSENIKPAIIFIDEVGAKNIISSFKTNENILSVMLYSGDDTLFASYFSDLLNSEEISHLNSKSKEQIEKFKNILKNDKKSVDISDGDKIYLLSPIILDNELIGVFYIVSNTTMLRNYLINLTLIQILITVITLFFIIYLSTKIHKIFTKPIFELVDVMQYISETKRFDIRIESNQLDEFKNLNDGFNSMIKEINSRDDNLNSLIKKLEIAKRETDEIHSQLRDSINYASLIQHAIMPIENSFKCFKDYFILWEPRDTVGGDIYLFEELPNDKGFLAMVIDCTGHGVAGAFVTMLVKAIEREIVSQIINQTNEISPAEILSLFNKSIKILLRQYDINSISNAGFDGGVLYINKNENYIKFSGAETSLFYIQNGVVETIKGCRHSIGYKKSDVNFKFKEHKIETSNETHIYITTDGFIDQIGGDKGFPFGKNRFKEILINNFQKEFATQKAILIDSLNSYRGKNDKTDDITILGFKI